MDAYRQDVIKLKEREALIRLVIEETLRGVEGYLQESLPMGYYEIAGAMSDLKQSEALVQRVVLATLGKV